MSAQDAPDWQKIVTTVTEGGEVTDAPDWERVVVGPGGTPVSGGASGYGPPVPGDFDLLYWTMSPRDITSNQGLQPGGLYLSYLSVAKLVTVTKLTVDIESTIDSFTANENFLGIYSTTVSGGVLTTLTLVAQTAAGAADGPLANTGYQAVDLSASYSMASGAYLLAVLTNWTGSTTPTIYSNGNSDRWPAPYGDSYALTSWPSNTYTSLPSSLDVADLNANYNLWMAVS